MVQYIILILNKGYQLFILIIYSNLFDFQYNKNNYVILITLSHFLQYCYFHPNYKNINYFLNIISYYFNIIRIFK